MSGLICGEVDVTCLLARGGFFKDISFVARQETLSVVLMYRVIFCITVLFLCFFEVFVFVYVLHRCDAHYCVALLCRASVARTVHSRQRRRHRHRHVVLGIQ